ncbi:MAG: TRC40/GET3/ArsA family transport-energizing ATPase [Gemmatimonadota bacterium]|nr:TRC40/GET3/ArsA family transport-energizing ATPase [Gemmatimonadota bacterium]
MARADGDGAPAGGRFPLLLTASIDRPILFFGGKGGVGKTTMATRAALELADAGHKTLLVSTDPAHSTSDILQCDLGPKPRPVVADCWAMEIDPEQEADDYIAAVKERIREAAPPRLLTEVERQVDIARVSPGAVEAALFDRFTRILEEEGAEYDRIVFDTAPTGQTLRLLSLPELMTAWMSGLIKRRQKVGALAKMWRNVAGSETDDREHEDPILNALEERRGRFHRARQILIDSDRTGFVFVVIPERLPIWETETAVAALAKHDVPVAAVIVNQILPKAEAGEGTEGFLAGRRERESTYLARIRENLGDWPLLGVRLQESDPVGVDALRRIRAEVLGGTE